MSKQTAVLVALWLVGAAGLLAAVVATVLLWRDVAGGETPPRDEDPDTFATKEDR